MECDGETVEKTRMESRVCLGGGWNNEGGY
jgi:hypothetical protein